MLGKIIMVSVILCLLCFLISITASCSESAVESIDTVDEKNDGEIPGWKLVWQDEFEGSTIDKNKWEHEVNAWGGGNNELQYYTDRQENSYVENGFLVIKAFKELYTGPEGTREYTSARMRTLNKGDWKYGRFEIKAQLPYGQGIWPAIWMLPTDWVYGGWAASGEIDIMELLGHETEKVYGTLHYGGEWPNNVHTGTSFTLLQDDFTSDFHLFAVEWDSTEFRWYVDSIPYQTQNTWHSINGVYPAPFDQRFHLLLNVAVGGNWPGNPDSTTVFPQTMKIDYVRVYSKED
jgi:beta-glucanase (GH16 family)